MTSTLPLNPVQPGQPHGAPPPAGPEAEPPEGARRSRKWLLGFWLVALVAFLVPSAGKMTFETKLGVAADPWKFIGDLNSLWHDRAGFGGIADQYAGYLFPSLPYYGLTDLLQIPVWLAERLWLSLIITAAFWGALRLAERLGIGSPGTRVFGAIVYALWPTFTIIIGSTSAGALPGAVLPWVLLPLADYALKPRHAAVRSALVIPFMGGVNAASTLAALFPALLYVLTRTGRRRGALLSWWIPGLILATLWWTVPLILLGAYGENFLPFIEQSDTVTSTMSATESLRGAGNWVAYLNFGEAWLPAGWTVASAWLAVIGSAFAAAIGLAGLARRDLPERRWLVLTVMLSVLIMLAGYAGALGAPFADGIRVALDGWLSPFRNIYKFQPGVALALAFGLAHVTATAASRYGTRPAQSRRLYPLIAGVLVLPGLLLPYVNGDILQPGGFKELPKYWKDTAKWLEEYSPDSRAMVAPATAHGTYTWGKPIDQPLDVLADSRWAQRDYVPFGTPGSQRVMDAVDRALMTGGEVPGLDDFLARAGLHYVVVRNDLDPDQTGYVPPSTVKRTLEQSGYRKVKEYGPKMTGGRIPAGTPVQIQGIYSQQRAVEIYAPPKGSESPGPVGSMNAEDTAVISGGPESLLQLSGSGDWRNRPAVLTGDSAPGIDSPPLSVQADGLRRADTRFGVLNNNTSYTYAPGQKNDPDALQDAGENPSQILPKKGLAHQTTANLRGAAKVSASSTGNWLFHLPQYDPANAFDGNPATGWAGGNPDESTDEWVRVDFDEQQTLPSSLEVTPLPGDGVRARPTRVQVETDRGKVVSTMKPNDQQQMVKAPEGAAKWLKVTITDAQEPKAGFTGAGFAEITVPDVQVTRMLRLPADAEANRDTASEIVSLHRGSDPGGLNPAASEVGLHRQFTTGTEGDYAITGKAVPVQGQALDELRDQVDPDTPEEKITATAESTSSLSPSLTPRNLVDGDLTTAWIAGKTPTLHLKWPEAKEISSMVLAGAGGISAKPTEVEITTPGGAVTTGVDENGWARFEPVTTNQVDIKITKSESLKVHNPFADRDMQLPVGITEVYIPGMDDLRSKVPDPDEPFELECGEGPTVSVDGKFRSTSAKGTLGDLADRKPIDIKVCGGANDTAGPVSLPAGNHRVESGDDGPLAVTDLTLTRGEAGKPSELQRDVKATDWAGDQRRVTVGDGDDTYLTTYENYNDGWKATLDGKELRPVRLDGWQQGFLVPSGSGGQVKLSYEPATWYQVGLWVAVAAILALIGVALVGRRNAREEFEVEPEPQPAIGWALGTVVLTLVFAVIAGPYALVVPALALLARARPALLPPIALIAMAGAGIAAATGAGEPVRMNEGAYSGPAQALALLALAAALVSVGGWNGREPAQAAGEPGPGGPAYAGAGGAPGAAGFAAGGYAAGAQPGYPAGAQPGGAPGPQGEYAPGQYAGFPPQATPEHAPTQPDLPAREPDHPTTALHRTGAEEPPPDEDPATTALGRHRGESDEPPELLRNLGLDDEHAPEAQPQKDVPEDEPADGFVPTPPIPLGGGQGDDTSTPPLGTQPRDAAADDAKDPSTPPLGTPEPSDTPPEDRPPEDGGR
ncbi:alpha-(1-_3)-arabinofuranosyltransferase domain-containing protein [Streptomyces boninensis]|uniref:alpha-(1->3)-arabinofuranosyltransferase domain-containing protein n=1 Tax=Streptomyces boninensis TaxID=2039455 RepID=UPI003B22804E